MQQRRHGLGVMACVEVVRSVAGKKGEAMTGDSKQGESNGSDGNEDDEVSTEFGSRETRGGVQQEHEHHGKKKDEVGAAEDGGCENQSRGCRQLHAERRRTASDSQTKQ